MTRTDHYDLAARDRARAALVQQAAGFAFGVETGEIGARTRRSPRASLARQVSMYLAHVAFEMPLVRVGAAFGRDRSTAAYACHRIEDRRDDPAFDDRLDRLEESLRAIPEPEDGASGAGSV